MSKNTHSPWKFRSRRLGTGLEQLETRCTPATLPVGFADVLVDNGLNDPVTMTQTPDGRFLIAEQGGNLRVVKNGSLLTAPYVSLNVSSTGERGLLGVAVDPNFTANNFVYVYYTTGTAPIHNRVSRFTANGDVAQAGSEQILIDLETLSAGNHNGGAIRFGADGKLYIATGDNAVSTNSQTFENKLGKILRINPIPGDIIPNDNPFLDLTTGTNRSIWALGLRNPFNIAVNPKTGRLHINDVGQNTWEEINQGIAGANYGWPISEGPTTNPNHTTPIFAYQHGTGEPRGNVITGGTFYSPPNASFPAEYRNDYFFSDLGGGWIWRYDIATDSAVEFADMSTDAYQPVSLQTGLDGHLYFLARNTGALRRISYSTQAPAISSFGGNVNYTAGGAATRLSGSVLVNDVDSPNFQAGQLRVQLTSGSQTSDRLFIRNFGAISVSGNQVFYQTKLIGSFTGGSGSTALVVTFNGAATPVKVATVMRNVMFRSTVGNPSSTTRVVQMRVTDGDGGTSNTVSKSILMIAAPPAAVPITTGTTLPQTQQEEHIVAEPMFFTQPFALPVEFTFYPEKREKTMSDENV